jgi:very-short-patch-repair endonuclease
MVKKGNKMTEEHKNKIRIGNIGKSRSEETKRRCSEASIKKWKNPEYRNHMIEVHKGHIHSEEQKNKIGEKSKIMHLNMTEDKKRERRQKIINSKRDIRGKTYEEIYGEEGIIKKLKIKEARKNQITPVKDTKIEKKIQEFLDQLGIEYFTHKYINIEHGYQCDIFIPATKTIIECDGDYFHANPEFFDETELNQRQKEQRQRDKKRTEELTSKGYKIIRLWENDIKKMNIGNFNNKLIEVKS